jgi:DNA repair protein RecN (Recombination protein N)
VGSRPVTAALLREIAPILGDIHGQHDQQLLFAPDAQRDILDDFAANGELRAVIFGLYAEWKRTTADLEELERGEQEKLRLLDLWTFQRREIEGARPEAGEDLALENERRVLQNLGRLQESAGTAYSALYDSPESALTMMRLAEKRIDELCRIDATLESVRETLRGAEVSVQEASYALRDYLSGLEANPDRLEEIEARLATLDKLKRKYGASLEHVLAFLEHVRAQIDSVEHTGERIEELRKRRVALESEYARQAGELSRRRAAAARKLEKRVESELASLAMERTVFRVEMGESSWSESGADAVRFLVSPNLGEEPRPIEKVASGGEISRIALALKTCMAKSSADRRRTLVFDEVDSGVGGSAAEGIGRRLKKLASSSQVLCVTHLPQIASFADHHYYVEKKESRGRTVATVEELAPETRAREIARMLSGQKLTPEALKHAEQMIRVNSAQTA